MKSALRRCEKVSKASRFFQCRSETGVWLGRRQVGDQAGSEYAAVLDEGPRIEGESLGKLGVLQPAGEKTGVHPFGIRCGVPGLAFDRGGRVRDAWDGCSGVRRKIVKRDAWGGFSGLLLYFIVLMTIRKG